MSSAIINTLRKIDIKILGAIVVADRVEKNGIQKIKEKTGITVESIIHLDTSGETSQVIKKNDLLNANDSL